MSEEVIARPLPRRAALLAGLAWIAVLAGCGASTERTTNFPDEPFPRRRGTHGNGANRS
jgi:ABC-type uncharacterized transport system auxiliary subunit